MYRHLILPDPALALPGRAQRLWNLNTHHVNGRALDGAYDATWQHALFGMGCFWGAEKRFWDRDGVMLTAVGYAGGVTPHPTYDEVCSGRTAHCEVVKIWFDPARIAYNDLLTLFWESHDPTQGMRQGNDIGSQYRSAIYSCTDEQYRLALHSRHVYGAALRAEKYGAITTEIRPAAEFYFAENEHQQYLAKHPHGYCGVGGCGIAYTPSKWRG